MFCGRKGVLTPIIAPQHFYGFRASVNAIESLTPESCKSESRQAADPGAAPSAHRSPSAGGSRRAPARSTHPALSAAMPMVRHRLLVSNSDGASRDRGPLPQYTLVGRRRRALAYAGSGRRARSPALSTKSASRQCRRADKDYRWTKSARGQSRHVNFVNVHNVLDVHMSTLSASKSCRHGGRTRSLPADFVHVENRVLALAASLRRNVRCLLGLTRGGTGGDALRRRPPVIGSPPPRATTAPKGLNDQASRRTSNSDGR